MAELLFGVEDCVVVFLLDVFVYVQEVDMFSVSFEKFGFPGLLVGFDAGVASEDSEGEALHQNELVADYLNQPAKVASEL